MAAQWSWTYLDSDGAPISGADLPVTSYPSQEDAEGWLTGAWPELAQAGVDAVSLYVGDRLVYGPMSLRPQ